MNQLDISYARAEQAYRTSKVRDGIVGRRDRVRARRAGRSLGRTAVTTR